MAPPDMMTEEFPDDLAERLNRLARMQTAGSRPWPGVEEALRRSHRRRVAAGSSIAVAGVLIAGAAFGTTLKPNAFQPQPTPPAATPFVTAPVAAAKPIDHVLTPQEAGLTAAIGGSLGSDAGWLEGVRNQVIAHTPGSDNKPSVTSPKNVLVLWAGDLNGARYAITVFQPGASRGLSTAQWRGGLLSGPVGAAPAGMHLDNIVTADNGVVTSFGYFVGARGRKTPSAGSVFVIAPKARGIEVTTTRRFFPDGSIRTTGRPLAKQGGAVWVGLLNPAELFLAGYQGSGTVDAGSVALRETGLSAAVRAIAGPGTDRAALEKASQVLGAFGVSQAERPVLAAGITTGLRSNGSSDLAAAVLRSPDGGYLYGFTERWQRVGTKVRGSTRSEGGISRQAFTDPDSFMAATRVERFQETLPGEHILVIAPARAHTVRIAGSSAVVHNRLAVLTIPKSELLREWAQTTDSPVRSVDDTTSSRPPITVQALDAAGRVIATVLTVDGTVGSATQTGIQEYEF